MKYRERERERGTYMWEKRKRKERERQRKGIDEPKQKHGAKTFCQQYYRKNSFKVIEQFLLDNNARNNCLKLPQMAN